MQQVGLGPYVVKYIATVSAYVETKLLAKVWELPNEVRDNLHSAVVMYSAAISAC